MHNNQNKFGPIAIGGLGGSGTRVVAELLQEIGFFLGDDLNSALDNLSFTLLFKRPQWFMKNHQKESAEIPQAISIFETAMTRRCNLKFEDYRFLLKAAWDWAIFGNHFGGIGASGRGLWPFKRVLRMVGTKKMRDTQFLRWGWKEPNSHIYIEYLDKYFKSFKYIHVIRHGLDMAFSRNQVQLYNWGQLFGIDGKHSALLMPQRALHFWIQANEKARMMGQKLGKDNFLVINFDELCRAPDIEVQRIIDFLDIHVNAGAFEKMRRMPKKPKTSGRYRNEDLTIFNEEDIQAVERFGFRVDGKNR